MRSLVVALLLVAGCSSKPNAGATIACQSAADCPPELPMCTPDSKICVGCIDDFQTCGVGKMCDQTTHTCVPAPPDAPCKHNGDCPRPGVDPNYYFVCNLSSGQCVECLTSNDCPVGACINTHCVSDMGTKDSSAPADLAAPSDGPVDASPSD